MEEISNYDFLEKKALDLGCSEAKVIHPIQVVIEDRVRLKCMVCPSYGNNLRCPPYTPSIDHFRKMLNEYNSAMVVKIKPPEISEDIMAKYNREEGEVRIWDQYQDIGDVSSRIWSDFADIYKNMLMVLLEIEREAFNQGYAFALSFFGGKCMLCEKCDVNRGTCLNPMMSRFASEAMGINVLKTAENAGMEIKFVSDDNVDLITSMAIVLID